VTMLSGISVPFPMKTKWKTHPSREGSQYNGLKDFITRRIWPWFSDYFGPGPCGRNHEGPFGAGFVICCGWEREEGIRVLTPWLWPSGVLSWLLVFKPFDLDPCTYLLEKLAFTLNVEAYWIGAVSSTLPFHEDFLSKIAAFDKVSILSVSHMAECVALRVGGF